MADTRWQAELAESKDEILLLRERISMGMPTVHKDLSLISLVPRWPGLQSAIPLEDFFFASSEGAVRRNRTV